jgi:hypothetical protein
LSDPSEKERQVGNNVSNPKMNIISQSRFDLMYDGFLEDGGRYELDRVMFGKERIYTL